MKLIALILRGCRSQRGLLLLLALAGGVSAGAQSGSIPGDADYSRFSQFIADRNIFDPARYPHGGHSTYVRPRPHTARNNSAPAFTLVGTMAYEKGIFAFFSGNSDGLTKILSVSNDIVGYTVTEITPDSVTLMGADKKAFTLKLGAGMHQENGGWQLTELNDSPVGSGIGSVSASTSAGGAGATSSASPGPPPPSTSLDQNDILKRLKQQREQENK